MLIIAGSGPGPYNLDEIAKTVSLREFDAIVLDRNYDNPTNTTLLAPVRDRLHLDGFAGCRDFLIQSLSKNLNAGILYIVSGSPTFFSGARPVIESLEQTVPGFRRDEHLSLRPARSSLDALLAATGTDAAETGVVSLHGRSAIDLEEMLRKRVTFVLCEAGSLFRLTGMFAHLDDGDVGITVGSRLGYEDERVFSLSLSQIATLTEAELQRYMPYSLLIERRFELDKIHLREDDFAFEGGMITRTEKRRLAIQALELRPGLLLWDIGAGSGSISIEAFVRHRVRTVLFEKNPGRLEDIQFNLKRHHVLAARFVSGDALQSIEKEEEVPDRIFVGGGGVMMAEALPSLYSRLTPGGILVAHYVVLNHLAKALTALEQARIPFQVQSLSLTHYRDGDLMLAETERLLFVITCKKSTEVSTLGKK